LHITHDGDDLKKKEYLIMGKYACNVFAAFVAG